VILHTLESDYPITWGFYHFTEYLEAVRFTKTMLFKLVLDQSFGGILEALLDLANANRAESLFR